MYKSLGCSVALIAGCACSQQQSSFHQSLFLSHAHSVQRIRIGLQLASRYHSLFFFDVAVLPF
jgi:hypothetical protein